MSKAPTPKFCPFCGSHKVKIHLLVPRCYGCNTVFFAQWGRTFKPRGQPAQERKT